MEARRCVSLLSLSLSANILSCCSNLERGGWPGPGDFVLRLLSSPDRSSLTSMLFLRWRSPLLSELELGRLDPLSPPVFFPDPENFQVR